MKSVPLLLSAVACVAAVGCKNAKKKNSDKEMAETGVTAVVPNITIEKLKDSPAYPKATLQLNRPTHARVPAGSVAFDFAVTHYDLGAQTAHAGENRLANSGKGQHIHFIVDDGPYAAHYEPKFDVAMGEGTHYIVAFLARSYHESVKNAHSFVAKKIVVGDASKGESMHVDLTQPTLIYSRPKGTYQGADTKNLLLDFFLLNTELSPSGNKVRATINGRKFVIADWAPYVIKGLPKGRVTVKLELLDADGHLMPGDFNSVVREVELK